jgi:hypothetical protein
MRLTRTAAALSVLVSLTFLAGCSGDGDKSDDAGKGDKSSSASGSGSPDGSASPGGEDDVPADVVKKCQATVSVTGAFTADWSGKAEVRISAGDGPKAVYRSVNGKQRVTAYSDGKDFTGSVNVLDDDVTYATPPGDDTGLDIGVKGKSAEIDADALDVEENQVHVTASFDC